MFAVQLSDELKIKLRKLSKKYPKLACIINKKIKQIINNDAETIEHYKNLRHGLSHFKHVHIDKHFVLTFKVNKEENLICFLDINHHDDAY
ncbi:hypothetical protein C4573_03140 [Candidatus Woesearchaeota archaeon]|nr:MAG: hypothetical protein C4573_03140 [Candidatus Woesearchaeota archaeon]